jgi:hypothetical protein
MNPRIPAAQYFATKGFFHDYNARLDAPLKSATAKLWLNALHQLREGKLSAGKLAEAVALAESGESPGITRDGWNKLLSSHGHAAPPQETGPLTRGGCLAQLYGLRW